MVKSLHIYIAAYNLRASKHSGVLYV